MKAKDLKVGMTVDHECSPKPVKIQCVWEDGNLIRFYGQSKTCFAFKKNSKVVVYN